MNPAWHQIVTRAFWRRLGQHRGFDIQESFVIHKAADKAGDFCAGFQTRYHLRATQIQIAVFQARFFAVGLIRVQRQGLRAVDDGQRLGKHFDFASRHVAVFVLLIACAHGTGDLDAEFVTQFRSQLKCVLTIGIKKHLHDAFTVAHVDKNQTAQIATAVYPAAKCDLLTHMRQIELSAIFCTHNTILLTSPLQLTASGRVT